jgi:hypothetical protein
MLSSDMTSVRLPEDNRSQQRNGAIVRANIAEHDGVTGGLRHSEGITRFGIVSGSPS